MTMIRPTKDEHFLMIAEVAGQRSPCLRRKVGAAIVRNGTPISLGFNGPARGVPNCNEVGCLKEQNNEGRGTYVSCRAGPLHGELNAIINAAREGGGTLRVTMYIAARDPQTGNYYDARPCSICKKAIVNAGIETVVVRTPEGGIDKFNVSEWVSEAQNTPNKDLVDFYSK